MSKNENFKEVEPKDAFTMLEKHRGDKMYVPLDVRTPKEYEAGHIENATLLNIQAENFEQNLEKLDKDKTYLVYCRKGPRSTKATQLMKKHGFKEVYEIVGGFDKWKSKRLPFEK
ncbi:rhodanese-like domain-containing protein [Methanobacterium sp. ACI-7]|uniref:rhodanese-like domain-containing protein n=1 Tax=unclassified Methanobacterium TaxID=2627676 RepID=UPI0039C3E664